jgi:hypothetical protein
VTVETRRFDTLDALAADAGAALERAARPCLFDRLDWYRLIAAHCPPPGTLLALGAHEGDRAAWLVLARQGRKASGFTAWYSLRFDAIGNRDHDLLAAMTSRLRGEGVMQLELSPLLDPWPLRRALRSAGWICRLAEQTGSWSANTRGLDFATYWAGRPGQLRSTAKRRAKAAVLDIRVHRRFEASAWAEYEQVYRASWKPEEGSMAFLRALAEQEGAAGALRLGIARHQGRPIAAQLWLVENKEAWIHKLAYAEDARSLSPGTLLGMEMFRSAIDEDRVERIDYGTGDDAYKRDWMDERRPLWRLEAFDPRSLSGLAGAARATGSRLAGRLAARLRSH